MLSFKGISSFNPATVFIRQILGKSEYADFWTRSGIGSAVQFFGWLPGPHPNEDAYGDEQAVGNQVTPLRRSGVPVCFDPEKPFKPGPKRRRKDRNDHRQRDSSEKQSQRDCRCFDAVAHGHDIPSQLAKYARTPNINMATTETHVERNNQRRSGQRLMMSTNAATKKTSAHRKYGRASKMSFSPPPKSTQPSANKYTTPGVMMIGTAARRTCPILVRQLRCANKRLPSLLKQDQMSLTLARHVPM